jgi:hypothetical protein
MLTGSMGILGPTKGFSILKLNNRATMQLMLIIIATVGFHTGVAGTVVAAASKIDGMKLLSPEGEIHLNHKDFELITPNGLPLWV